MKNQPTNELEFLAVNYGGDLDRAHDAALWYIALNVRPRDWTLHTLFEHDYMGPGRIAIGYEIEIED